MTIVVEILARLIAGEDKRTETVITKVIEVAAIVAAAVLGEASPILDLRAVKS
jgi:hypothetical protein